MNLISISSKNRIYKSSKLTRETRNAHYYRILIAAGFENHLIFSSCVALSSTQPVGWYFTRQPVENTNRLCCASLHSWLVSLANCVVLHVARADGLEEVRVIGLEKKSKWGGTKGEGFVLYTFIITSSIHQLVVKSIIHPICKWNRLWWGAHSLQPVGRLWWVAS